MNQDIREKLKQTLADYDKSILEVLHIHDHDFFDLSILARERYVHLTRQLPTNILTIVQPLIDQAREEGYDKGYEQANIEFHGH